MNKRNLIISSILTAIGAGAFITSLVLFIKSYSYYADEYGTDISFNQDYTVCMILSLIVTFYGIYKIYLAVKNIDKDNYYLWTATAFSTVACLYPLGVFFKALFKALSKKKAFDYSHYQWYLYIGIIFIFSFVYFIVIDVKKIKEKNKKEVETTSSNN